VRRATRRGRRARRVGRGREPVQEAERVIDERDELAGDHLLQRSAGGGLELAAEGAEEVDVGVDGHAGLAEGDAVAVGRDAGGERKLGPRGHTGSDRTPRAVVKAGAPIWTRATCPR